MNLKYTQKEQWYNFANIFFIIILINQSVNQVGVYFNILLLFDIRFEVQMFFVE